MYSEDRDDSQYTGNNVDYNEDDQGEGQDVDMEGQQYYDDEDQDLQQQDDYQEYQPEEQQDDQQSFKYQPLDQRKWQWAEPLIEGVPPCARGGHSATLSGASIILFGGHYYANKDEGYKYLNDTYQMDVNANRWFKAKVQGTPPAPRYAHSAVLAGQRIIIFGGKGEKCVFRDLHALDPLTLTWYQGPEGSGSPSARFAHSATLYASTKMIIFGGWNGIDYFNDLYVLDLEVMAWSQPACTGPSPTPRQGHTAIQVGANLIIQGGFYYQEDKNLKNLHKTANPRHGSHLRGCYLNDIRILDTEHFAWSRLRVSGTPPAPRYGHSANVSGADIVVFGGWSLNSGARSENNFVTPPDIDYLIVLNTEKMCWEKAKYEGNAPRNRYGHTATSIGPHILIFGGWEYNRATNQVVVLRDLNVGQQQQQQQQQEKKK
ncbi:unnamed protein product [Paramecium sonneborni]|uniref:Galactose oxidase n=1 Tax=Paramecium sonneborni TaxID=65129 RepID=A0A8S1LKN0_9CILI|nr:unnamed protein product [Paramecium sonneborni]